MNYKDITLTANGNLRKSKLRTFLTISAVFMGALTLMLTTGVGFGLKSYVDEQVGNVGAKDVMIVQAAQEVSNPLGAEPKEYDPNRRIDASSGFAQSFLQQRDIESIRKEKGIIKVEPYFTLSPDYITSGSKKFITTVSQGVEGLKQQLKAGRLIDENSDKFEVTLPPAYVSVLGFKSDQDAIDKTISFGFTDVLGEKYTQEVTVVGVQEKTLINGNNTTGNTAFFKAMFERTRSALPDQQKQQYFAAVAKFDSKLTKVEIKDLQKRLKDQKYNAQTLEDQLGIVNQVINGVISFLTIFAAITLLAATFGIVNTLLMAVKERTREIGLMKALGMGRKKIFLLFSLEAVLIGFWGSFIALIIANILGRVGNSVASKTILKDFEGLQLLSFPAVPMIGIILLIMGIAFLAATLPARRASRLDPIEALRYE